MVLLKNVLIFDAERVWQSLFRWFNFLVSVFSVDSKIVELAATLSQEEQAKLWNEADRMVPFGSQARDTVRTYRT